MGEVQLKDSGADLCLTFPVIETAFCNLWTCRCLGSVVLSTLKYTFSLPLLIDRIIAFGQIKLAFVQHLIICTRISYA